MKAIVKYILPDFILHFIRNVINTYSIIICYIYDLRRFCKYTSTYAMSGQDRCIGKLILYYHVLEKGLSFENRRNEFGGDVAENLIKTIKYYVDSKYDVKEFHFKTACSVLKKYFEVNEFLYQKNKKVFNDYILPYSEDFLGGKKQVTKSDVLITLNFDFSAFFNSRHSIREFSEDPVDINKLYTAFDISKKYPSVCNRQAIKAYLIVKKESVEEYLKYQNGNRGFRDKVDKLIIVTADLTKFAKAEERNQPYIDGGIYLMSLLLSIHSQGLGAVALNWSTSKKNDLRLRSSGLIRNSETVISFIGVGNLKEIMTVPCSEREDYKNTITVIDK